MRREFRIIMEAWLRLMSEFHSTRASRDPFGLLRVPASAQRLIELDVIRISLNHACDRLNSEVK